MSSNTFIYPVEKKAALLLALCGLIILMLGGCGFDDPPDLQQEIRKFFYEKQTDGAHLFVEWAEENLDQYSDRRIQEALYIEGEYHAEIGHPNAISVISFAARAWAYEKGLNYNDADWYELQEVAIENIPMAPGEAIKLWSD